MIRVFNVYFSHRKLLLAASEALLIFLGLSAATWAAIDDKTAATLNYENGFFKIALACVVCMVCMYYYDLYESSVLSNPREVLTRLVQVLGTACLILALLYYTYPPVALGIGIFLVGIVLVGLGLAAWRRLFFALNRSPYFAEQAVVLGEGSLAASLVAEIRRHPELGVRLAGYVGPRSDSACGVNSLPRLGSVEELPRLVDSKKLKRVIVALNDRRGALPVEALLQLKTQGVLVEDGADVYEAVAGKVALDSLRLSWLLFSPGFRVSRAIRLYKRGASMVAAGAVLALCLPLLPLIGLAVKLSSRGPVLYRQKRVGRDGRVFTCYKFRTMQADAEADSGPTWACDDDPRITPVGRFLRRARLDEIPQLWNVLLGDMHLVGPRPERPEFVQTLSRQIPYYHLRHSIRPGITGWAQISYHYGNSVEDAREKLQYDLFYIKNVSLGLDLMVFLETVKVILLGRGAR
jgi:sugar transferase (PEP-CTERM system associated)